MKSDNVIYILHPSTVKSQTDSDSHYIDARTLARLYNVKWEECQVMPTSPADLCGWKPPENAVHLHPQYDGNYDINRNL